MDGEEPHTSDLVRGRKAPDVVFGLDKVSAAVTVATKEGPRNLPPTASCLTNLDVELFYFWVFLLQEMLQNIWKNEVAPTLFGIDGRCLHAGGSCSVMQNEGVWHEMN